MDDNKNDRRLTDPKPCDRQRQQSDTRQQIADRYHQMINRMESLADYRNAGKDKRQNNPYHQPLKNQRHGVHRIGHQAVISKTCDKTFSDIL